jgi:hypothetical protein
LDEVVFNDPNADLESDSEENTEAVV